MDPKEKAQELISSFENVDLLDDVGGMDIELARQCAVICADEVIKILISDYHTEYFWKKVKDELIQTEQ